MTMVKKFSLLVALALLVTVGGVYAVWTYTASEAIDPVTQDLSIGLQDYELLGAAGQLELINDGITISFNDDKDASGNPVPDHIAELVISGSMLFVFTPDAEADPNDIDQMELQCVFQDDNLTYQGHDIFVVNYTPVRKGVDLIDDAKATELGLDTSYIGKYYFTLDAADLTSIITINGVGGQINLPTLTEYNAFKDALTAEGAGIKMTISTYSAVTVQD